MAMATIFDGVWQWCVMEFDGDGDDGDAIMATVMIAMAIVCDGV